MASISICTSFRRTYILGGWRTDGKGLDKAGSAHKECQELETPYMISVPAGYVHTHICTEINENIQISMCIYIYVPIIFMCIYIYIHIYYGDSCKRQQSLMGLVGLPWLPFPRL